jgi:hypothetical protein
LNLNARRRPQRGTANKYQAELRGRKIGGVT